jgi:ferredoxin
VNDPCPPSVLSRKANRSVASKERIYVKQPFRQGSIPYKGLNNLNNCGGVGQCGTCVIEVLEGAQNLSPRSDVEEVYLSDRPANYRLSCRTSVNGDVTVRTRPDEGVGKGSNSLLGAVKNLFGR